MHVIYVTGIGDTKKYGQRFAVALWRLHGVTPHFFNGAWGDVSESYGQKLDRLLTLIDRLHAYGKPVSIVGASAGASLSLHAYAARKSQLHGVVCISGKIHNPERIQSRVKEHNPAFMDSLHVLPRTLSALSVADRQRILSVYSDGDNTVPMDDSLIEDTNMRLVGHGNHVITISNQITFGAGQLFSFLKQLPSRA